MSDVGLAGLSPTRRTVLEHLKRARGSSISAVAEELGRSYEAARQQLAELERRGWVAVDDETERSAGAGRPGRIYRLTRAGENLFPKDYAALAVELIDAVGRNFGRQGLRAVLADLTDARVEAWAPELEGKDLAERLEALRDIYRTDDPWARTTEDDEGPALIEENCPFLDVARERPALCSLTVATLRRLLGVRVVREERFQDGDGRCVFRVLADRPETTAPDGEGSGRFRFEDEADGRGDRSGPAEQPSSPVGSSG